MISITSGSMNSSQKCVEVNGITVAVDPRDRNVIKQLASIAWASERDIILALEEVSNG